MAKTFKNEENKMTDKKANKTDAKAVDATVTDDKTKAKAKVTTKKKGATMRTKTKTKKNLKSMKSKPATNNSKDLKAVRVLCNKVLTSKEAKKLSLTLVENAKGAIQVKRDGALMFSFRKTGRGCIISHPIYTGRGASKKRWMKHSGSKWDHLTDCSWSEATLEMLIKRIKDKNTPKDHHDAIYKGKTLKNSGLKMKAEMARKRIEKLSKDSKKATNKKKREKTASKKASTVVKRQAKKTAKKKAPKASKVVAKAATVVA
jgi:hypothetical protein